MSNNILIAIRLCGEIDNDGGGEYGSEDGEREEGEVNEVADGASENEFFELKNYSVNGEEDDRSSDEYGSERSRSQQDEEEKDGN